MTSVTVSIQGLEYLTESASNVGIKVYVHRVCMLAYMCDGCGPYLDSYDMLLQNTSLPFQYRRDILFFLNYLHQSFMISTSEVLFCYYIVIFLETMLGER